MMYLESKILEWAEPKGLLNPKNVLMEFAKTVSEIWELGNALIKNDLAGCEDGIGDAYITLVILANQKGLTMEQCVSGAYNEIKNRNGKTLENGNFVKELKSTEDWISENCDRQDGLEVLRDAIEFGSSLVGQIKANTLKDSEDRANSIYTNTNYLSIKFTEPDSESYIGKRLKDVQDK